MKPAVARSIAADVAATAVVWLLAEAEKFGGWSGRRFCRCARVVQLGRCSSQTRSSSRRLRGTSEHCAIEQQELNQPVSTDILTDATAVD